MKHVSLVRTRPGDEPARVLGRVGVYLPKDKAAAVAVPQAEGLPPTAVGPFETDPEYARDGVTPRDSPYTVAVAADSGDGQVTVNVPFRSTLKKIQADYSGPVRGVVGRPRLVDDRQAAADKRVPVEGRLTNDSGLDLIDVLMVFRSPFDAAGDQALWLPQWPKGQTIELASLWTSADAKIEPLGNTGRSGLRIGGNKPVRGAWRQMLTSLHEGLRGGFTASAAFDDHDRGYARSYPLVSLFGRSPAMINTGREKNRVDLTRRGVRQWDVSPAVAAGAMVVLAQADGPLPVPMTVDGDTPGGTGRLFFQCVLPVDRSAFQAPPSTQPAD